MKQENLDELRNIYLGLVTGGEGPEVLNEGFGPFLSQAEKDDINRNMKQRRAPQPVKEPKAPSSGTELQKALAAPTLGYDPDKGSKITVISVDQNIFGSGFTTFDIKLGIAIRSTATWDVIPLLFITIGFVDWLVKSVYVLVLIN